MKFVLILLVLLPLALSATLRGENENEIMKRSLIDLVIQHLQSLDLSQGCVKACEENVSGIGQFFCSAACRIKHSSYCNTLNEDKWMAWSSAIFNNGMVQMKIETS